MSDGPAAEMDWPPKTGSLAPAWFDGIVAEMAAKGYGELVGVPIWHRGDDTSIVWPKPEPKRT